jgi:hypothetical protein
MQEVEHRSQVLIGDMLITINLRGFAIGVAVSAHHDDAIALVLDFDECRKKKVIDDALESQGIVPGHVKIKP